MPVRHHRKVAENLLLYSPSYHWHVSKHDLQWMKIRSMSRTICSAVTSEILYMLGDILIQLNVDMSTSGPDFVGNSKAWVYVCIRRQRHWPPGLQDPRRCYDPDPTLVLSW